MQNQISNTQEALQILTLKNKGSSTVSYQISQDLQPNNSYYNIQTQLDEITFDLVNQDTERSYQNKLIKNILKKGQQGSHGKLPSMFLLLKHDAKQDGQDIQSIHNTKIYSEKKKNSMHAIKELKYKIFAQRKLDQFSKKYTDLFDSIFFKKQEDKDKYVEQDKKQLSLMSTMNELNELLSTERSMEDKISSSTSIIDEANQPKVINNASITPSPKIIIKYEHQAPYNMKPQCENENRKQNFTPKAKINFTYGQPQKIDLKTSMCIHSIECS